MNIIMSLAEEGGGFIEQELSFVVLLSIAALVAIIIRRIKLPYTVALVLVGLAFSFFPSFLNLDFINSQLILALLVPPLLFEATLHIKWNDLRRDLATVVLLAVVGSLLGTFIVGGIVRQLLDIPLAAAIAFGALISATDPVAVIAFFRTLGVSKRLSMLVEGESLFNDGVAVVIFNLALAAGVAINNGETAVFVLEEALFEFIRVGLGGLAIGALLGYVVSYVVLKNVDDHLIETATSVALAFGAFVIAEELHLSGILSVVAAGLMVGNIGMLNTSPTTKVTLENFWEFMAFVVNSLVFLVIGLEIQITQMLPNIGPIIVAVLAVLLSRMVVVYGLTWVNNRLFPRRDIPLPYRHVMYWGGLRGAISLALALTLTGEIFGTAIAQELRVMTFGVVLFTLLGQGTTIDRLIDRLKLGKKPAQVIEQQRQQAILHAKWAGRRELERLQNEGILFRDISEAMDTAYSEEIAQLKQDLRQHLQTYPELEQEMMLQARADVLRAERSAIGDANRRGFLSEELYMELIREADKRAAALELVRAQRSVTEAAIKREDQGD